MSVNSGVPDYDLPELVVVTEPVQLRALADPLRLTLLDLALERAATVKEFAAAVGRPHSTVAHHVDVLVNARLLRVVRTRRVRAIEERYYGRIARTIYVGAVTRPADQPLAAGLNRLSTAAAESAAAHRDDDLRALLHHARIPRHQVVQFWSRVQALAREFAQIPRDGDTVYGFVAGLYPTEHPTLPVPTATAQSRPPRDRSAARRKAASTSRQR